MNYAANGEDVGGEDLNKNEDMGNLGFVKMNG